MTAANQSQLNQYITSLQKAPVGPAVPTNPAVNNILSNPIFKPSATPVAAPAADTGGFWGGLKHAGSAILDLIERPFYAVGAVQANEAENLARYLSGQGDKSVGQKLGESADAFWQGLSGKNKVTSADVLAKYAPGVFNAIGTGIRGSVPGAPAYATGQMSDKLNNFYATLGVDFAADPINLAPTAIKGLATTIRAFKGLGDITAAKNAITLAVDNSRTVPKARLADIKAAQTADELAVATEKAANSTRMDHVTNSLADLHKANLADQLRIGPTVLPEEVALEVNKAIKAGATNVLKDGGHANLAQGNLLVNLTNQAVKKVKDLTDAGQVFSTTERRQFLSDDVMPRLKAAENALENAGINHYVTSGPSERNWAIKTSDWLEVLPKLTTDVHHWAGGRKAVQPSSINGGIAKGLDIAESGLARPEAVRQIVASMRASGRTQDVKILTPVASKIYDHLPQFIERVSINKARIGLKHEQDVPELTGRKISDLQKAIDASPSDLVSAVTNAAPDIAKAGRDIGASTASIVTAQAKVAEHIAKSISAEDFTNIKYVKNIVAARRAGVPAKEILSRVATHFKQIEQTALEEAKKVDPAPFEDLSEKYAIGMEAVQRAHLTLGKNPGTKALREFERGQGVTGFAGMEIGEFNRGLNAINKAHTMDEIQSGVSLLRQEGSSGIPELDQAFNKIFDTSPNAANALVGSFWRNGGEVDQINAALKDSFGAAESKNIRFDEALAGGDLNKLADQWKDWKIENPLDFLSKAHDALRKLTARQTVAVTFENNFGSLVHQPGFVHILSEEGTNIAPHINPDLWFDPEHARQLHYVEHASGASRTFSKEAAQGKLWAKIVNEWYDPMLSTWKTYATIVRLGHHVRNFTGDGWLSAMAGMKNFAKWYGNAHGVMHGNLGTSELLSVTIKGKRYNITGDQALRAFKENGLKPNYHTTEDILNAGTKTKVGKLLNDNKLVRAGGLVSEQITEWGRLSHFLWHLSTPDAAKGVESLDQAFAVAAREVRKWHPDASGLAPFESKVMRRIIPFYSWIRQAIPLVMETTVTRPGVVTALPKFNYDIAVANGVNPQSLTNQFPEKGIYPSYFTDNILGPNNMFGSGNAFNTGSPVESVLGDTLNTYSRDPSELFQQISPLLRTPVEYATSKRLGTGKTIVDRGELIDQSIPLVSNFASISGYSPTGTLTNALGFGPANAPIPDPLRSAILGNKQHWLNQSLVNFISGIGIRDYNNPSDQRNAMREARGGVA